LSVWVITNKLRKLQVDEGKSFLCTQLDSSADIAPMFSVQEGDGSELLLETFKNGDSTCDSTRFGFFKVRHILSALFGDIFIPINFEKKAKRDLVMDCDIVTSTVERKL